MPITHWKRFCGYCVLEMLHKRAASDEIRAYASIFFLGIFVTVSAMIYFTSGTFSLTASGLIAGLATGIAILRVSGPLREVLRKANQRDAQESELAAAQMQAERDYNFGMACVQIAKMMAKLSNADLSVFVTADQILRKQGDVSYRFTTSAGRPVHAILVAMCDVGCARPVEMKRVHPETDLTIATYELSGWGRHVLRKFITDALRYRTAD